MLIKITRIIETKKPFQPVGKSYQMFSWIITGEIDGNKSDKFIELKAFKAFPVVEGETAEVEAQNYQGTITYKILSIKHNQVNKEKTPVSTASYIGRNEKYSLEEYNDLFCYAWDMFEPKLMKIGDPYHRYECLQKLISTFIISAVQNGIKAPRTAENSVGQYEQRQQLLNTQQGVA
ncbi:MAG: hypothetical protein A2015_03685 [Spirochaetes bacterium GWF1_31_7]|nr:MAG: hypothetical protein A2Y29_04915 [Spirochaetes bacterium GWE2_31_10]OHD53237.1 MAG: hypothetical protein A2015_03685 [Spirochaetes bacterium GWF1_31_7]OHD83115.1 MAG: hypothetical protein A2355_11510 [Spirochaetes bacterium RIFOXYB1_FULL_32_8]HBI39060.1 hypothetical protein [Spirochaetia bacterium]